MTTSEEKRLARVREQLQALDASVRDAESRRKELMDLYLHGPRKERPAHKALLDQVRQELADRQTRRAETDRELAALEVAQGLAGPGRLEEATHVLNRLRSALAHEDWLVWTRSVWKFKDTESAAKTGRHPAQFSAVLPYRLIKMFSYVGETVLDPFVGMGTTLYEAWKLERHAVGIDVNPRWVEETRRRLETEFAGSLPAAFRPVAHQGDARDLKMVPDESVHLVVTHPPYWNAVRISDADGDLSACDDDSYEGFLAEMGKVFCAMARVLREERVCCVVTGDVLRKVGGVTQLFPLHADYVPLARRAGFVPWDTYIWETKIRDSHGRPMMGSYPYPHKLFSQFAHNYILVFRKAARH